MSTESPTADPSSEPTQSPPNSQLSLSPTLEPTLPPSQTPSTVNEYNKQSGNENKDSQTSESERIVNSLFSVEGLYAMTAVFICTLLCLICVLAYFRRQRRARKKKQLSKISRMLTPDEEEVNITMTSPASTKRPKEPKRSTLALPPRPTVTDIDRDIESSESEESKEMEPTTKDTAMRKASHNKPINRQGTNQLPEGAGQDNQAFAANRHPMRTKAHVSVELPDESEDSDSLSSHGPLPKSPSIPSQRDDVVMEAPSEERDEKPRSTGTIRRPKQRTPAQWMQ